MKFSDMNEEQRNRTVAHCYFAHQLIKSNNGATSHPKKEDNNNIPYHQNSPVAVSPHMKMNNKKGDKMPPIKAQEVGIIPHTKITAGFKNDTNNISNMTNLTAHKVILKSPFPVTSQKEFVKKNSIVKITPEKPSKCVVKENCVPSKIIVGNTKR